MREYRVPGHETFAGYYEIQPVSADGAAVLAHASIAARKPLDGSEDVQLGFFELASGTWTPVAATRLWCWQMGARLRWWDEAGERVLAFNALHEGKPAHCLAEAGQPVRRQCDVPLFDADRERRIGLSLNFARLARCRPGYGYPALEDPFARENLPAGDGITLVDLASGKAELAYAMPRFAELVEGAEPEQYHYLNAALLSPAGSRFSVLYKRLTDPANVHGWQVDAVVGKTDGSQLVRVPLPGRASHYWWLDEDRILYTANRGLAASYVVFDCRDGSVTPFGDGAPKIDGHPSREEVGGRWITDQYPDLYGEQALYLLRSREGAVEEIARMRADPRYQDEWRCDLHPRWSRDGASVIVDSTHEGYRGLYAIDAGTR